MSEMTTENPPVQQATRMLEIAIECPPVMAGYLEELLWTLKGVETVAENYNTNVETDQTTLSDLKEVVVYTRQNDGVERVEILLDSKPKLKAACKITRHRWVEESDWAENWKQYWHPTRITEKLTICPTWERDSYQPESPDERIILLDPGSAFGTGTHETTQLVLKEIETLAGEIDFSQVSMLDVGTGSGILAIYAAMLGCRNITAIDNDPVAVAVTRENVALNHVESAVNVSDALLDELCRTKVDVILANIIAPVILELFDDMLLRLEKGGRFIASGLIAKSVDSVETAMRERGFTDIKRAQQGDWFALTGRYEG